MCFYILFLSSGYFFLAHNFFFYSQAPKINKKRNNGFKITKVDRATLVREVFALLPSDALVQVSEKECRMESLMGYRSQDSIFYKIACRRFSNNRTLLLRHSKLLYYTYISNSVDFHLEYTNVGGVFSSECSSDESKSKKIKKKRTEGKSQVVNEKGACVRERPSENHAVEEEKNKAVTRSSRSIQDKIMEKDGAGEAEDKSNSSLSLHTILDKIEINDSDASTNRSVTIAGIPIEKDSLSTLSPGLKVDDTIINAFGFINEATAASLGKDIIYFDTNFSQFVIANGCIPNFDHWLLHPKLFLAKVWLLPLNERGDHWTLYIVDFVAKKITYINSLLEDPESDKTRNVCSLLQSYFDYKPFGKEKIKWGEWKFCAPKDIPMQCLETESNNCGLHILMIIVIVCTGKIFVYDDSLLTDVVRQNIRRILTENSSDVNDRTNLNIALLNFKKGKKKKRQFVPKTSKEAPGQTTITYCSRLFEYTPTATQGLLSEW